MTYIASFSLGIVPPVLYRLGREQYHAQIAGLRVSQSSQLAITIRTFLDPIHST